MNTENLKALLRPLRDLIMSSRVAYKDYVGTETVVVPETLIASGMTEGSFAHMEVADESLARLIYGRRYRVKVGDEIWDVEAVEVGGDVAVTSFDVTAEPPDDYWGILCSEAEGLEVMARGSYVDKLITLSTVPSSKVQKKYKVKKLAYELLPDKVRRDIAKVQSAADTAQSTADTAQSIANTAHSTADTAQSAIDVYSNLFPIKEKTITYSFDGDTTDRPTFEFNAFPYWKVSDLPAIVGRPISGITESATGNSRSAVMQGTNCTKTGGAIVVFSPGQCRLAPTDTAAAQSFKAPESGVYFLWKDGSLNRQTISSSITYQGIDSIIRNS